MTISFKDRVAIVTGAGGGLGRQHALQFAERGARVVVNDFGGEAGAFGGESESAAKVVDDIKAAGGEAIAHGANVSDPTHVADMVGKAMDKWGRIDVLVNNAGILRDASFAKMTPDQVRAVTEVHLHGSIFCSLAVWPHMKAAGYGRIVMTSSTSGVYGNFGQANYGAAKTAMIGLMNCLHIEGAKNDIRINTLIPGAATKMTEGLLPEPALDLMDPGSVSAGVLFLASEEAPSRVILAAQAGGFSRVYVLETEGVWLDRDHWNPDAVAAVFSEISDKETLHEYTDGSGELLKFLTKAAAANGVDLKF